MISDKRRYVSRNKRPANPGLPPMTPEYSMAKDVSGDAAADGFTTRYRKPLERDPYPRDNPYREDYACEGLMNEDEVRKSNSIYYGDY